MNQLMGVKKQVFPPPSKSLGGILAIQEKIAAKWLEARQPVVIESIPHEAIDPAGIHANLIPAEVIEDIIDAHLIEGTKPKDATTKSRL